MAQARESSPVIYQCSTHCATNSASVESAVCKFHRKLFNVHLFLFFFSLLDNYFRNVVAENHYNPASVHQNFIFES